MQMHMSGRKFRSSNEVFKREKCGHPNRLRIAQLTKRETCDLILKVTLKNSIRKSRVGVGIISSG